MAVLYSQAEGVGVRLVFLKCFGFNQLRQNPNQTTNGHTHTYALSSKTGRHLLLLLLLVLLLWLLQLQAVTLEIGRCLFLFVLPLLMLLWRRRWRLLSLLGVVVVVADDRTTLYLTANVRLVCRGSGSLRVGGKTAKESR